MATTNKKMHEPLFHISKRGEIPWWKAAIVRAVAILAALIVCGVLCVILIGENPFKIYGVIFEGAFGTERRIWILLQNTALLLGVGLAVVPAFKMKFWNLGANGQVLMGALATTACMWYFGGKMPDPVLNIIMVLAGVAAGVLWAVIPAIFKAIWNTNESLFTLMMNYIAAGLVSFCIFTWDKSGSGTIGVIREGWLPEIGNKYLLVILVVALLTALMHIYLKFSKQGYEISVVGESENTAKYIGINVKKVVIRTLIVSGALCGIIGCLLSGAVNHTVNESLVDDRGFTAILVAWLGKFNPLLMILTSFFVVFLDQGTAQVNTTFNLKSSDFSNIIIGIIFFFIIGCEFFITYKVQIGSTLKEWGKKIAAWKIWKKIKSIFKKTDAPAGEIKTDEEEN